ncbi:hypothetical protein [Algoriphagus halophilus]|uniref:Uncharacterized protein n=1 Tax=Algoriphagus halophilus TaxID=226505 RepID=A0A1N6D9A4_9BACT|nr:hypothetical protein [Algoriphagus halophilus]SIN67369.1 hypothetical protein SAMN05444394_0530 [Algoriphagus halophilus]
MIKKIWTDPVWSKVISVGIIGLLTLGYTKFVSVTEKVTFREAFNKILEIKIEVVYVILALVTYWVLKFVYRKIFKKEKAYYSLKQQKLRSFNKTTDPNTGILFKWGVFFNYDRPFISDLTAFCTKHGDTPIRFMGDSCSIQGCENSRQRIDKHAVKNLIESDLIDRWEKIK